MAGERDGTTTQDEAWSPSDGPAAIDLDLPGYRDFVLIARGGESVVYRARQEALDRLVAIKVLSRDAGEADGGRLFQRELEITMRLGQAHPNIVTVLDTRLTGSGEPCIVMEYYELGSLHDQLRAQGRLPASAVVAAGTVVADALAYAHGQGVLHRDVKPQNILVLPTSYVLADFGLARLIGAERSASLERFSYRHAAPQVLDGELPTAADDVYSLASTLFTLLDGRPPFASDDPAADTALAYLRRARTEAPRPTPAVPKDLAAVINRGLARQRQDRFPDAGALRDALADIATEARVWAPGATIRPQPEHPDLPTPRSEPSKAEMSKAEMSKAETSRAEPPRPEPLDAELPGAEAPNVGVPRVEPRLARSAIEHLELDDLEPTGRKPEAPPEPAPPAKPAWPRLVFLAGLALLLGGAIGLVGTWVTDSPQTPAVTTEPTGRPVPTYTGAVPSGSAQVEDQSIAPQIITIDDRGSSVEITWTDRSGGQAAFVIVDVTGGGSTPVRQADPGETSVVIDRLNPATPRYCYQIIALTDRARGISVPQCTELRT